MPDLQELNYKGLLALEGESEDDFLQRTKIYHQPAALIKELPLPSHERVHLETFDLEELNRRFDLCPTWIYLFYSNDRLMLWEAACTWTFKLEKTLYPVLQFRKAFKQKKRYFGYPLHEILQHEVLHAVRAPLNSRRFEEMICYRASKNKVRGTLSAILQNPHETILYLIVWLLAIFASFSYMFLEIDFFFFLTLTSVICGLALTLYGIGRLLKNISILNRAFTRLKDMFSPQVAEAVLVRLNDEEIIAFAKKTNKELEELMHAKVKTSIRWQQIAGYSEIASKKGGA